MGFHLSAVAALSILLFATGAAGCAPPSEGGGDDPPEAATAALPAAVPPPAPGEGTGAPAGARAAAPDGPAAVRETPTDRWRPGSRLLRPPSSGGEASVGIPFLGRVPRESVEDAIPLYEGLMEIFALVSGGDHPNVGRGHHYLAGLHAALGEDGKAEEHFRKALAILEASPDLLDAAGVANNLGMFLVERGEVVGAVAAFERSLELWGWAEGADPFYAALAQDNLASTWLELGDLQQADAWGRKARASLAAAREAEPAREAAMRQNQAVLLHLLGRHGEAEGVLRRVVESGVLAGWERASSLTNLAEAVRRQGRHGEAEALLEQALAVAPEDHPGRALVLSNLAVLHLDRAHGGRPGAADRAVEAARAALELRRRRDPASPETALSLVNLGMAEHARGRLEEGAQLLSRAVSLAGAALPAGHPGLAGALENLAFLRLEQGRPDEARELAGRARAGREEQLRQVLSFGSEADRLGYLEDKAPYDLLANLAPHLEDVRPLADAVLRSKGVVLDSLLEERRRARRATTPEGRRALLELARARRRWMEASLAPVSGDGAARDAALARLAARVEEAEEALARESGGLPPGHPLLGADAGRVRAALEPGEALVEVVLYQHHLGRGRLEPRYGALVLGPGGEPRWEPLGPAAELDGLLERFSCLLGRDLRGVTPLPGGSGCGGAGSLEDLLRELHRRVWEPVAGWLPADPGRVFFGPDAALHFLPLQVLLDGGGDFLVEHQAVVYVGSGRDLLSGGAGEDGPPASGGRLRVYAEPDYGGAERSPSPLRLADLPFTGVEADALVRLGRERGWRVEVARGEAAREASLRRPGPAPDVLHLATHGFAGAPVGAGAGAAAGAGHPMLASFLALAGAQSTLDAWSRGEVPPPADDGVLTAAEVGDLPLAGTWLAVLSACETGLGEARPGEGVFGLRRGFALAGARHLLTALWPVEDAATAELMAEVYGRLLAGEDPAAALAAVQRRRLRELRERDGLEGAVLRAGGFVVSQGGARGEGGG